MSGRRAARFIAWVAALTTLLGCDQVGRSLVDEFKQPKPLPSNDGGLPNATGCFRELPCGEVGRSPAEFPGEALVAPDLSECEPCQGSGARGDAVSGGGEESGSSACPDLTDLEALVALGDGATLSCTRQHVQVSAEPGAASVTLRGLRLERAELTLEAQRSVELILEASDLNHVMLHLEGPVSLLIRTPGALSDVQMGGVGGSIGAPSVHLEHHVADQLRIGSPDERFEGRVTLERVAVENAQIVAQEVRLESTTFYEGLIDAASLSAVDTDLDTVELRVDEGQLAAGRVRDIALTRCGRFELLGMDSNDSRFGPCSEGPLRIFESFVVGGLFDGDIETEATDYSQVRFGLREETRLVLWTSAVYSSAFCVHMQRTEFGGYASCVGCAADAFTEPGELCHPRHDAAYASNFCEAFWSVPLCEHPTNRPRPPHGRDTLVADAGPAGTE